MTAAAITPRNMGMCGSSLNLTRLTDITKMRKPKEIPGVHARVPYDLKIL